MRGREGAWLARDVTCVCGRRVRGDGGGRAQADLEARAKVRRGAQGERVVCGVAAHPSAQTRRVGSCAARVVMGRISGRERASGGRAW